MVANKKIGGDKGRIKNKPNIDLPIGHPIKEFPQLKTNKTVDNLLANELRIGNYLCGLKMEDPIRRINDSIQYNYQTERYELDCIGLEYFEPIPITEEWLLKFGFEWCNEVSGYFDNLHAIYLKYPKIQFHPFCTNDKDCWNEIEYVHQLQNLYFALTGTELVIKNN